jgi:hypothetical protein
MRSKVNGRRRGRGRTGGLKHRDGGGSGGSDDSMQVAGSCSFNVVGGPVGGARVASCC